MNAFRRFQLKRARRCLNSGWRRRHAVQAPSKVDKLASKDSRMIGKCAKKEEAGKMLRCPPQVAYPLPALPRFFIANGRRRGGKEVQTLLEQKLDKFGEQACAKLGELELSWTKM